MKTMVKEVLDRSIREFVTRKAIVLPENFDYDLVLTKDRAHGDFAANAAFKLAKLAGERPALVADELVLLIQKESAGGKAGAIHKVEVAGAGFINFHLLQASLAGILPEVHRKDRHYGESDFGNGKKVLIEFVSANPTGPLTIAHGRQAAVGDCLVRILKATGHAVKAEYYLNDAGRQMNLLGASLYARYAQAIGQEAPLPEDGYQGAYLMELGQKLKFDKGGTLLSLEHSKAVDFCREYAGDEIMKGIREDLKAVDVHFDHYFNESSLYEKGSVDQALNELTDRGFLYEQDGALWFRSTTFGDDKDRVVKKTSGEYTYLAPDIAYHKQKFERGFNWIINLWGPDHHGYIARLKAACQAFGYDSSQVDVLIVQLSTLFRQGQPVRMSTRAGEFVTLRELVDETGSDAVRFFFLMRKVESHLDFDLDLAKEKSQENPVYYLQYAHARIASLIRFAGRPVSPKADLNFLVSPEENDLVKCILDFPKALVQASEALEPFRVADYLRELAAAFHKFYSAHRVVSEDENLTDARLLLVDAVRIVLRNGLHLLGISQPESM